MVKLHSPLQDSVAPLAKFRIPPSQAAVHLLAWLLRSNNANSIAPALISAMPDADRKRMLKKYDRNDVREAVLKARTKIFTDGRSLDLKLLALRLIINSVEDPIIARKVFMRSGFSEFEAAAYIGLLQHPVLWPQLTEQLRRFRSKQLREQLTLSPSQIRREAMEDFTKYSLFKFAGASSYRKLRFIAQANRFDIKDMENDLIERAMSWYYLCRPLMTRLHAINYARNAISSGVQKSIEYWTTEDRARLISTPHGYENVCSLLIPDLH